MSSPDPNASWNEPGALRDKLAALDGKVATSARHDDAVLARMRTASAQIRGRSRGSRSVPWLVGLAASFAVGVAVTLIFQSVVVTGREQSALLIPASTVMRNEEASAMIPVEQADPAVWYRHIQELIYSGEREEAQRHLERFNELHPDYVHQP
jgi:hypothetical protein